MDMYLARTVVLAACIALAVLGLASCSGTAAATAGSQDYYWASAREAFGSGEYAAAADDLDHLTEPGSGYAARAIPWSLVLTTGMANGYIELADDYMLGARANPGNAPFFRGKATEYRKLANPLVMRAAGMADRLEQLPPGSINLTFGRPRGSLIPPPVLFKIARGLTVSAQEADTAVTLAVERNVLRVACAVVGSPDDSARAASILGHASTITPRAVFSAGMARMLEEASAVYSRSKLDLPDKLVVLQSRVKSLRAGAEQAGPAMMVRVQASGK